MDDIDTLEHARELLIRAREIVADTGTTMTILNALERARAVQVQIDAGAARSWNRAYACAVAMMARAVDPASGKLADVTGYLIVAEYDDAAHDKSAVLALFERAIAALDARLAQTAS